MKITFQDRAWDFDADRITLQQGVAIHMAYGMTVLEMLDGLRINARQDGGTVKPLDSRSLHCLYWLMLAQDGQRRPLADVDANLVELMAAYIEGLKAEVEAEAAAAHPEPDAVVPTSPPPGDQAWSGHGYQTATTPPSDGHPYPPRHDRTGYSPSPSPGYGAST